MAEVSNSALNLIAECYSKQFSSKGATHEGVLWTTQAEQTLRFQTMLNLLEPSFPGCGMSVNDLGCGYGAFFLYLRDHPALAKGKFYGYDLCQEFIDDATQTISDPRASFHLSSYALHQADYSFASGTFNFKGPQEEAEWNFYIKDSLRQLFKKTGKAMVFNLLDRATTNKHDWLYYADPDDFYEFCRKALPGHAKLQMNPEICGFTICITR